MSLGMGNTAAAAGAFAPAQDKQPTYMDNQQAALNFIEDILSEVKTRLSDAGFFPRELAEKIENSPPQTDNKKDVISNATHRIKKLVVDLKDQVSQVC